MSPSSREREREYARRRYEKWASKQQQRVEERRRARRNAAAAAAAVVGVLVVVIASVLLAGRNGSTPSTAAAPSPSASAAPSVSASGAAKNPCPAPTVKPPAPPASFKDVPPKSLAEGKSWKLTLETTCGTIVMQLDGAKAPQATASAIFLARKKFWDGSPCHRLTTEGIFVLQCGDPTGTGSGGPGYDFGPVENAPKDGRFPVGTLAMARASSPDSNGSQFFIVYKDTVLEDKGGPGYTIFGKVISGMDIVQKVAAGGLSTQAPPAPARPISIVSTSVAPA